MKVFLKLILISALAFMVAPFVHAAPSVTISVSPATGLPPYTATVTWSTTESKACTAFDGWTGSKAVTGTQAVTVTAATKFTLTCTGEGQNLIKWIAPTTRADGTPLTDLAGFKIYRGTSATVIPLAVTIPDPSATSYAHTGLAAGTYFYAVSAYTSANIDSDLSPVVQRVATIPSATASAQASVVVKPSPPTNVTVETVTAYEYRPSTKTFVAIGLVPEGVPCGPEELNSGLKIYCRVKLSDALPVVWPQNRSLREVWIVRPG